MQGYAILVPMLHCLRSSIVRPPMVGPRPPRTAVGYRRTPLLTLLASLLTVHGRSTGGAARPGTKGSLPTNFHSSKAARACSALPASARWIKSVWSRRRSQHQRPVFSFVPLQVTCRKLISISVHFRTQHLVRRSMAFHARRVVIKPCAYVHRYSIALAAVLFFKGSL